jgi:hypothetical protein
MTRSDDFEVAMPVGSAAALPFEGRGVPAGTRARVADTDGDGKIGALLAAVQGDVVDGWPWRTVPPALSAVLGDANPGTVPGDSTPLRVLWTGWNYAVALPATAVLYTLAWLLQHPARAIPVGGFLAAIILISIYG